MKCDGPSSVSPTCLVHVHGVDEGKHDTGKGDRAILSWQLRVLALESVMFTFVLFLFYLFIQNIKLSLTYFHTSCRMLVLTCKHDDFSVNYIIAHHISYFDHHQKQCDESFQIS